MRTSCPVWFWVILCFIYSSGYATPVKDSNVLISSAQELHQFVYNKKAARVEVKQILTTTYYCNSFRTTLPVVEMYDNETSIDNVEASMDGKKLKDLKPAYEYYAVNDIFFSDTRVCYFNLALQTQGATGEVRFEKTITDPRYFTSVYLTDVYKIKNKQVTLRIPRWMKVDIKELNFAGYTISKTSQYDSKTDEDVLVYIISDAAGQEKESSSPGPSYLYPHLLILTKSASPEGVNFTYFNTLKDQYGWYRTLVKSIENDSAVLKQKATEITTGLHSDMEKIKAIFYWVQNNIRYIAFEDGMAGFKPEKANEVLRRKYGDCKGMAHLTKELLKSLGYDARLCWIGTNHIAYDYSTPSMSVDNHMICALNYNNKQYFLDATETYIGFNEYAERIQGRQILIEDGDNFILARVPTTTQLQNSDHEKAVLSFKGTELDGVVEREWKGEEKENILSQLNAIKKDKSKDAFMRFLAGDNKEYLLTNFTTSDLNNYDGTLTAKYDLSFKNAVSSFGKDYYIDLDVKKEMGKFIFDEKERAHDFWFNYKMNTTKEVTLNIPAGYAVSSLPGNLEVKNPDYEFTVSYTQQPGKLVYKKSIVIKNTRLSKTKFGQWNSDVAKLARLYNEQIVLTTK